MAKLLLESGSALLLESGDALLLEVGGVATVGKIPTLGFTAGAIKYVTLFGFTPSTGPITLTGGPAIWTWTVDTGTLTQAQITLTGGPAIWTWVVPKGTLTGGIPVTSSGFSSRAWAPFNLYSAIVPSDTVNLIRPTSAIYVGGTGDIEAVRVDGTVELFVGVPVGTILQIDAMRVNSAGTTATFLVALWNE